MKRSLPVFLSTVLAVALNLCPSIASAQFSQNPLADYMQVNVKGWIFCPVTDSTEVRGYIAYLEDEDQASGSNIQLAWYEREANDTWTTWGWNGRDFGAAASWVRFVLDDPTAFSRDDVLGPAAAAAGPEGAVTPKQMANGLFFDDPLQPSLAQSSDPETVVYVLTSLGWASAPQMSEVAVSDPIECNGLSASPVLSLMNDLTSRVETAYFGQTTVANACVWPCTCTTTWTAPYACGPWIFDYSSPGFGGGLTCHYHRACSRDWSKARETWLWCSDCTDPGGTESYNELGETPADPGDPCVAPNW